MCKATRFAVFVSFFATGAFLDSVFESVPFFADFEVFFFVPFFAVVRLGVFFFLEPPAAAPLPPPAAELPDGGSEGTKRPARYGLMIHYESRPEDAGLARLVDTVVWVNDAHPAYARAMASRAEGYHLALCVAMASLVTEPGGHPQFITEFLRRWGKELGTTRRVRK